MGNRICCGGGGGVDDRLTRPQRLVRQPSNVDYRKLRRLILAEKLAPCFDASDDPASDLEECPICFFHFPSLNRSRCCTKGICTECFLQMKPSSVPRSAQCPFCKTSSYAVEYRGARTQEEKFLEQEEEQKVIEAKIRMRCQDLLKDGDTVAPNEAHPVLEVHLPQECFEGLSNVLARDPVLDLTEETIEADESLEPNSRRSRDGYYANLEDVLVMEAIRQSLKDPLDNEVLRVSKLDNQAR